jgi:hypothetical protein
VVADHLLVQPRDAVEQLHLGERILRRAGLHLEHLDELRPLAHGVVEGLEHEGRAQRIAGAALDAFERRQGRRVIRHLLEQLAIELDRARDIVEALLVELGDRGTGS